MRHVTKYLAALTLLVFAVGCDSFLDVNTDPNAATAVPGDLLLPVALVTIQSNRTIEIGPGNAIFVNIWNSNGSTGVFNSPGRYILSSFTVGNSWSGFYGAGLRNLTLMRTQALEAEPARNNVAAQAEIMRAYVFFILTMLWEDVPFTQALDGANFPSPEFDSQETVLRGIVDMLDDAVASIDPDALPGVTQGDIIYGGDMEKWVRFANSLKLRTLMFIRNQDTSVDSQIQALLSQPLIRSNADEAMLPFFETPGNENNFWKLHSLFGGFGPGSGLPGSLYMFAGSDVVDLMKSANDPRLSTYFSLAVEDLNTTGGGGTATNEFFGQAAGVQDWNDARTAMVSRNIVRTNWPNRILTASEVWFYEAEYLAEQGQLGPAHASYVSGVEAALNFFDGKPGAISSSDKAAYLAGLPQSFTSTSGALNAIHAQQYIEVFDRAPENWAHWKRTKFPQLQLAEQADLAGIIRRFSMPPDEVAANPNAAARTGIPLDQPMWFER
jgi:hypothetical protein